MCRCVAPVALINRIQESSVLVSVEKETNALNIFTRIPSMFKQQTNSVNNVVFLFFLLACGWPSCCSRS